MKQFSKKGFTLVEIMIVVVIIGLLAALAIPAFKKVRNNAVEKSMINDARQISSAAQQHMSENAATYATVSQIGKYLAGGKLSAGVMCGAANAAVANVSGGVAAGVVWDTQTATIVHQGSYFTLGHPNFDASLSSNNAVVGTSATQGASAARTTITFTETGSIN